MSSCWRRWRSSASADPTAALPRFVVLALRRLNDTDASNNGVQTPEGEEPGSQGLNTYA